MLKLPRSDLLRARCKLVRQLRFREESAELRFVDLCKLLSRKLRITSFHCMHQLLHWNLSGGNRIVELYELQRRNFRRGNGLHVVRRVSSVLAGILFDGGFERLLKLRFWDVPITSGVDQLPYLRSGVILGRVGQSVYQLRVRDLSG